ncbi:hypothetical protein [Vibrio crassostreae]|uniref:hypothetical protein n=1 Tax=Vibrio crassostreae TaxID=246167 RepID=UPI001B315889|nr:hypothetical protein [Vibrio crassostreae]
MATNLRILKKLSRTAAKHLPLIDWDFNQEKPHCEAMGDLKSGTPILWYRGSYEVKGYEAFCAWSVLLRCFNNARTLAACESKEWWWGKPTPENVFWWAYWNEIELEEVSKKYFAAQPSDSTSSSIE